MYAPTTGTKELVVSWQMRPVACIWLYPFSLLFISVDSIVGIHFSNVYMILWDFAASDKDEMDLKRGDLVFVAENKGKQEWLHWRAG